MTMTQHRKRFFPLAVAGLLAFVLWIPGSLAAADTAAQDSGDAKKVERSSARSSQRATRSTSGSAGRTRASATRPRGSTPSHSVGSPRGSSSPRRLERSPNYYRGRYPSRHHYGYRGHSYYYGGYPGYYYYPSYGFFGYYPFSFSYFGWGGGPAYYRSSEGEWGALDLDVRPEKARIYVDGQRIGVADNFDGFPSYLWLEEGTYDIVIYKEGYETIARQYTIYPGVVIDVEDRMVPGESVLPEDLMAKSTARREERLRQDRERVARVRLDRRDDVLDARGEPGRLALAVEPSDASIYLDGRFLGTADELGRLHSGLIIDSGEHSLHIVRPGYEGKEVEFEVESGGQVDLSVELDEN